MIPALPRWHPSRQPLQPQRPPAGVPLSLRRDTSYKKARDNCYSMIQWLLYDNILRHYMTLFNYLILFNNVQLTNFKTSQDSPRLILVHCPAGCGGHLPKLTALEKPPGKKQRALGLQHWTLAQVITLKRKHRFASNLCRFDCCWKRCVSPLSIDSRAREKKKKNIKMPISQVYLAV